MNLGELQQKLIAAARSNPPGDAVPYGFEKRIMAHLRARPALDCWAEWAGSLWRAAVPCVAVMLLLSAWSAFVPVTSASSGDLSQEIENTVLAAVDQEPAADSGE